MFMKFTDLSKRTISIRLGLSIKPFFYFFVKKIEFSKLNLKIEFPEPLNGSWKVLGCNTESPN